MGQQGYRDYHRPDRQPEIRIKMRLYWLAIFTILVGLPHICFAQAPDGAPFGKNFKPIDESDLSKGYVCRGPLLHTDDGKLINYINRDPLYENVDRVVIGLFYQPDDELPPVLNGEAIALRVKEFYEKRFKKFPENVKETDTPRCYGRKNQSVEIILARGHEQKEKLKKAASDPNTLQVMLKVYKTNFKDIPAVKIYISNGRSKDGINLFNTKPEFAMFPLDLSDEENKKRLDGLIFGHMEQ